MRIWAGVFWGLTLAVLAGGCAGKAFYDDSRNWAIRNNEIPGYSSEYDVFFLYPSQIEHTSGETLNWKHEGLEGQVRRYVYAMTNDLARFHARVFSPFVPQLGFDSYRRLLEERARDPEDFSFRGGPLEPAIRHTVLALEHYLKHFNPDGRPFILIGQEQGALILYEAMKRVSDVSPKNGFAAAYFLGMPGVTKEKVLDDFGSRDIAPASGRYDFGVLVFCNTQLPGEKAGAAPDEKAEAASNEKAEAAPGCCVINPLSWQVDEAPAPARTNPESTFYLRSSGLPRDIEHFCGAKVDLKRGVVLLTELPEKVRWELRESVFPSDAWGLFAGSISRNAGERIREYLFRRQLKTVD